MSAGAAPRTHLLSCLGALEAVQCELAQDTRALASLRRMARALGERLPERSLLQTLAVAAATSDASSAPGRLKELLEELRRELMSSSGHAGGTQAVVLHSSPGFTSLLVRALEEDGLNVVSVAGVGAAREVLERERDAVLIVELEAPAWDARDLLVRLRRRPETATTPVVVLGDGAGRVAERECAVLGADAYRELDHAFRELRELVCALVTRRGRWRAGELDEFLARQARGERELGAIPGQGWLSERGSRSDPRRGARPRRLALLSDVEGA